MSGLSHAAIVRYLVQTFGVPQHKAERAAAEYAEPAPKPRTKRVVIGRKVFDFAATKFKLLCKVSGLPIPVTEHYFALELSPPRQWRFDFAWPEEKIALEVEGGIYSGGRHVRGKGYAGDMEKYSTAATLGWRLVRVQPRQLCTDGTVDMLRKVFP